MKPDECPASMRTLDGHRPNRLSPALTADLSVRLSVAPAQLLSSVLGGPQRQERSRYSDTPFSLSTEWSDTAEEAPMPKQLQPAVHVINAPEGMSLAAYATAHGVPSHSHQHERAVITAEDGTDLTPVVEGWRRDVHDHQAYLRGVLALKDGGSLDRLLSW